MSGGYALDMKPTGFGLISLGYHASAVYADPLTDDLYLALDEVTEPTDSLLPTSPIPLSPDGKTIYKFNPYGGDLLTYRWKSKLYVLPKPVAFLAVQVKAESYENMVLRLYRQELVSRTWVDVLIRAVVVADEQPIRLPMSEDYTTFWWEIISTDTVRSVQIGEDIEELD